MTRQEEVEFLCQVIRWTDDQRNGGEVEFLCQAIHCMEDQQSGADVFCEKIRPRVGGDVMVRVLKMEMGVTTHRNLQRDYDDSDVSMVHHLLGGESGSEKERQSVLLLWSENVEDLGQKDSHVA